MEGLIEFLKKSATIITTLAALAAWVPFLLQHWWRKHRKPSCIVVDYRIMNNGNISDSNYENKINGTILVLALNCFVSEKALFAKDYSIEACIKGTTKTTGIVFDGMVTEKENEIKKTLIIPDDYNFNLHREIVQDKDNVRIIPFLLKNVMFDDIKDVNYIKITLQGNKETKTLLIEQEDFPVYNRMGFLCRFVK